MHYFYIPPFKANVILFNLKWRERIFCLLAHSPKTCKKVPLGLPYSWQGLPGCLPGCVSRKLDWEQSSLDSVQYRAVWCTHPCTRPQPAVLQHPLQCLRSLCMILSQIQRKEDCLYWVCEILKTKSQLAWGHRPVLQQNKDLKGSMT